MITLECSQCGKSFKVRPHRVKTAKFCSHRCYTLHGRLQHKPQSGPTCQCVVCGKAFYVMPYRKNSAKYCSRSCLAKALLPQFAAGFQKTGLPPHKYKALTIDGKKVRLHRHLMEQHLGRKLSRDEHVHHINGDSFDNRLENLVVLSNGDHQRLELLKRPRTT